MYLYDNLMIIYNNGTAHRALPRLLYLKTENNLFFYHFRITVLGTLFLQVILNLFKLS